MARKRLIAGIAAALLVPSAVLAQTCPTGMSKSEIGTRYLVTEFMVAALACGNDPAFRESYGSFVRRYNAGLVGNAQAMKAHFGGGQALDSYVTRLANHAALRQNDGAYCSHARLRIDHALQAEKSATLDQIIDKLGYSLGGPACGDNTPVAALATKDQATPAKAQATKPAPVKAAAASPTPAAAAAEPAKAPTPAATQVETPEAAPPMPAAGGSSELSPSP
jgi:cell division septation protein DedD